MLKRSFIKTWTNSKHQSLSALSWWSTRN